MLKLKIIDKDKYNNYKFINLNDNLIYNISINFIGVKPKINDIFYVDDCIVKMKNIYNYGLVTNIDNTKKNELAKLIANDNEIYLERYYG